MGYVLLIAVALPVATTAEFGENIEFIGDAFVSGYYYDVQVAGDLAFACNAHGLMVFDAANPDSIKLVGRVPTPGIARALAVDGSHAYIGDEQYGLVVVDISAPSDPQIIGDYEIGNYGVRSVYVLGSYAYVGARSRGLYVFDICDPTDPQVAGQCPVHDAYGVWVEDTLAYIADFYLGVSVLNVSRPDSMFEIGSLELPGSMVDIYVQGDYAYVAAEDSGMRIVDVSRPDSLFEAGHFDEPEEQANAVCVVDTIAYIAYDRSGLQIVDVSDPENPLSLGEFNSDDASGIFVQGEYAYLADGSPGGLRLIDIHDPAVPVERSSYQIWGTASRVFISGNYAFVCGYDRFLGILDVSDPAEPQVICDWITPGNHANDVYVRDTVAYVAAYGLGLKIANVANPAAPVEISTHGTPSPAVGIDVVGDYAYVACSDSGLRIVDISDPDTPWEVGFYDSVYATQVDIAGNYAYLAGSDPGLHIVDVSDPSNPWEAASLAVGSWPNDIHVSGNLVYLAASDLTIVDVSDPAHPFLVDQISAPGFSQGVYGEGRLAYLATTAGGLFVYDVGDTSNVTLVGRYQTPGQGRAVFVVNDTIYVADEYDLSIYHFTGSVEVAESEPKISHQSHLAQNYPNPFRISTTISYTLPRTSEVVLRIYDSSGRLVAIPVEGRQVAGEYLMRWTPQHLPAGVYFYRLSADGFDQSDKMLYLKGEF